MAIQYYPQQQWLTEAGFNRLIMRSRLPSSVPFQSWVEGTVLPRIFRDAALAAQFDADIVTVPGAVVPTGTVKGDNNGAGPAAPQPVQAGGSSETCRSRKRQKRREDPASVGYVFLATSPVLNVVYIGWWGGVLTSLQAKFVEVYG